MNTTTTHRRSQDADLDARVRKENAKVGDLMRRYPLDDPTLGPARRRATRTLLAELLTMEGL